LFLYPWQSWFAAPWDLFIEHGHRLLGAAAGLVAIGLVAVVLLTDRRRWLVSAAFGALALVIVQGILGGARVLFDARLVALIHGCVGPLFFAYLAGLIVATSMSGVSCRSRESIADKSLERAAWITVLLAYIQLVLGALVRHVPLSASPQVFRAALILHLVVAAVLTLQIVLAAARVWRLPRDIRGSLLLPAALLPLLIIVQLSLGAGTYVAKYAWPAWLGEWQFAAGYVVQEEGFFQSLVTTAHVACGSLILFVAVVLAARSSRLFFAHVDSTDSCELPFAASRLVWHEASA
jgi:cytochrome c oxidase assembly protein subunit 15